MYMYIRHILYMYIRHTLCICIYVTLCICIYVTLCICIYVTLCICIYVTLCICIYVTLCICIYVTLCICIYITLGICIYVTLCICKYVTLLNVTHHGELNGETSACVHRRVSVLCVSTCVDASMRVFVCIWLRVCVQRLCILIGINIQLYEEPFLKHCEAMYFHSYLV